ncbi:hypothetical protein [Lebetimonas natsushimae]|uniref:hypothetical protein n=1 Tax=Lebetimonas natsushimae TaxID=1936991 RepID=UPI000BB7372C|nr:hypothetical protein [Lebetimonas natsushimae]
MDKAGLIIGLILAVAGLYYIDENILLSFELNQSKWFGRYVFFATFNVLILWVLWVFYKKFGGLLKITMPVLFGIIVLFIGIKLA